MEIRLPFDHRRDLVASARPGDVLASRADVRPGRCAVGQHLAGAGYFWPMWPFLGWGIGLAAHALAGDDREPGPRHSCRDGHRSLRYGGSRLERPNRPRSDGCDDLGFRPTFGATAQDRVGDQLPMTGSNCILTTPMIVRLLILR